MQQHKMNKVLVKGEIDMKKICFAVLAIVICFEIGGAHAKKQPYTCAEMRTLSFKELKAYKKNVGIMKKAIKKWAKKKRKPRKEEAAWVQKYTTIITIGMQSASGFATIYSAFCKK